EADTAGDGKGEAKKKPYKHTGLILEGKIGVLGCFRTHCRAQYHHDAAPGLALGGFVGGNLLFGFLDVGLEAGWGRLRPRAYSGRNVLDLYSVDPARLQQVVAEETGAPVPVDFSTLTLGEIQSRAIHAGPTIRVHVTPRGRVSAYLGAVLHYQQWRSDYETVGGKMRIGWHGIGVPLTAGVGGYVLRRLAIG